MTDLSRPSAARISLAGLFLHPQKRTRPSLSIYRVAIRAAKLGAWHLFAIILFFGSQYFHVV